MAASIARMNSMPAPRPIALIDSQLDVQAVFVSLRRAYSARNRPATKPMGSPSTGMTKKPMTASTPPSSTEVFGTSMDLSLRPVSTREELIPAATQTRSDERRVGNEPGAQVGENDTK